MFHKNEVHDHLDDMMYGLSHQGLGSSDQDFNMIGLDEEEERFLDIGEDIGSFTDPLGEDGGPGNLWF